MNRLVLLSSLSLCALAWSGSALAQDTQAAVQEEAITVTGSRITRQDYSSSSPVVTVDVDQIDGFGNITVEEALNVLPQFVEGQNAGTVAIGGGGGATLNMRALGSNRNLVLADQRRLPVSTPFGDVDVNVIPTVALRGVEVLTGGASSVYGSEAISGVVNFQTANYFDGLRMNVDYGDAFEGGAQRFDTSAIFGSDGERARGIFAVGYTDRAALRGRDRDFFLYGIPSSFIGTGTYIASANNPILPEEVTTFFQTRYGISGVTATNQIGFNDNGSLFTQTGAINYQGPTTEDSLFAIVGGNVRQPVGRHSDALKGLERYSAFARGEFDFNPAVTGYAQLLYSDATTTGSASLNITFTGPNAFVSMDNRFIPGHPLGSTPGDLWDFLQLRDDPSAPFILNQRFMGLPNRTHVERFTTAQFIAGLEGDVGIRDWTFDAYYAHDSVAGRERVESLLLGSRLNTLLQAADGGASICAGGYNPFGLANATSISAECMEYLAPSDVTSTLDIERDVVEGFITGSLFSLPAGTVQFSVSAGLREDQLDYHPAIEIQNNDAMGIGVSAPTFGQTSTTEFGAELLIPLLAHADGDPMLDLTAGARVADQDVTTTSTSWNVGLEFRPADSLFLRGSVQRAVRSPNIGELFSSNVGGEVTVGTPSPTSPDAGDPCDIRNSARLGPNNAAVEAICLAQGLPAGLIDTFQHTTTALPSATGGNPDLEPEEATTYTIGTVWRPQLSGQDLAITLDYWNIEIEQVIGTVSGSDALTRCFRTAFNPALDPNNQFCQLIERNSATGTVDRISATYLNLAALRTSGVDLQVSHSFDLGPGTLSTLAAIGWVSNYERQGFPGEQFFDYVGTIGGPANRSADNNIHPEWTLTLTPTYEWGPASLSLRWRYLSSMDSQNIVTNASSTTPGVPSISYFDLYGSYQLSDNLQLQAGISNLADEGPPVVDGQIGQTRIGTYDVIGRAFNISLRASF